MLTGVLATRGLNEAHVRRFWPIVSAALCLVVATTWLGWLIQKGSLTNKDEFMTAERSREMLLVGLAPVHENFRPSFQKPPLQYWLSALTLTKLHSREVAVRIWPLVYGIFSAVAIAWLALLLEPNRPWLIPLSVFMLLACPLFFPEACRALLDAGLTFFATLAIVFSQLARKHPGYWLVVGVLCVLGALQKIPLICLIWGIVLVLRFATAEQRGSLRTFWLPAGLAVGVIGMLVWPLWQVVTFHVPIASIFRFGEAVDLARPERLGARPFLEIPFRLVTTWPCGFFALLAAFYFVRNRRSHPGLLECAVIALTIIGLSVAFNFRSARYVLPVLPILALLLADVVHRLFESRRAINIALAFVILFLSAVGCEVSRRIVDNRRKDHTAQLRIARELGRQQNSTAHLVIIGPDEHVLPEQFYLFYGDLRVPVKTVRVNALPRAEFETPAAGVCAESDLPELQQKLPALEIALRSAGYVCWRAL